METLFFNKTNNQIMKISSHADPFSAAKKQNSGNSLALLNLR